VYICSTNKLSIPIRIIMNKTTQEVMDSVNVLIQFYDNIPSLLNNFPDTEDDINLIEAYVAYEIKKTLKDIIHIERL
jgi:hypothetical protein